MSGKPLRGGGGNAEPIVSLGDVIEDITYALDLRRWQVERLMGESS